MASVNNIFFFDLARLFSFDLSVKSESATGVAHSKRAAN